ncbi:MAG: ABC transporter ATP-binding protein [Bacteroidota bacterium]
MIKLSGVSKTFRSGFQKAYILEKVDLEIQQGEFVTIMGPSGAGKSTLLNILGLLEQPNEGSYFFKEKAVHKLREKEKTELHKHHIGFVFQAYHLIDDLTVYENIETPLLYRKMGRGERKDRIQQMLVKFNLDEKKSLFPHQLSGGQQQLVGIARAVVGKPSIILADEPTGNLHTEQGAEIMELFSALNSEGITIVQVTHSEKNATYGNRIIRLVDGKITSDVQTDESKVSG